MARACKQSDCRMIRKVKKSVSGFGKQSLTIEIWRCSNCNKTFEGKDKAWRHLWSIF